jgi:hypothetical protein
VKTATVRRVRSVTMGASDMVARFEKGASPATYASYEAGRGNWYEVCCSRSKAKALCSPYPAQSAVVMAGKCAVAVAGCWTVVSGVDWCRGMEARSVCDSVGWEAGVLDG